MAKPMPQNVAERLSEARTVARKWLDMQYASGLHAMNTGRRDKYPPGIFADAAKRGQAALLEIERIKAEYS